MGQRQSANQSTSFEEPDDVDAIYGVIAVSESAVVSAHEVYPRVFLGSIAAVADPESLIDLDITHVVSCLQLGLKDVATRNAKTPKEVERISICRSNWLSLDFNDSEDVDLQPILDVALQFMDEALCENNTNKVVVHCLAGASRSASIVIAYLITRRGFTAEKALKHVQDVRHVVNPNRGFRRQLKLLVPHTDNKLC